MKKLCLIFAAGLLWLPLAASAENPFDGTWKVDTNKVDFPKKPDVYLLQNGMYSCKTCTPPYEVKADGSDQKVSGHPYYDTVAVKVVSDHEVEITMKKDGKVSGTTKVTVAPDGKTEAFEFTDTSSANGATVSGKGEAMQVAKGPAGSNAISGSWRTTKIENNSESGFNWTYKVNGDELTMTNPTGQTYTAKMNGMEAPMKGDPGITTVSIKPMGKDGLQETDMRNGKVIAVIRMKVSGDGKMMNIDYEDKLSGQNMKYVATKQ
jgi:hypothetical protein